MPRKTRQFEVGGFYHIFNRGVDKRNIFLNDQDSQRFILGLEFFNSPRPIDLWPLLVRKALGGSDPPRAVGERLAMLRTTNTGDRLVDVCAFALMSNHYHLILREITTGGISAFMKKLGGYASYFNLQHGRSGTLFQGRYRHVPLTSDSQLSIAFTYVHTNPIELVEPLWKKEAVVKNLSRAQKQLDTYRFTSYHDYLGKPTFPHTTQRDFFNLFFKERRQSIKQETESWIQHKAARAKGEGQWPVWP